LYGEHAAVAVVRTETVDALDTFAARVLREEEETA
jgi:hypothetical protein